MPRLHGLSLIITWIIINSLISSSVGSSDLTAATAGQVVSIEYQRNHVCTGIQLDIDFVLTSSKCVNQTELSQVSVALKAKGSPNMKVNKITINFGFALLNLKPPYNNSIMSLLTATESPERGEECEVLTFTKNVS